MNQDKQQHIAEKGPIPECPIRREYLFRQIFPHQQLYQGLANKSSQRASCRMHPRSIGKQINRQSYQKGEKQDMHTRGVHRHFQDKIEIQKRCRHPQEMNVIQNPHLEQHQPNKLDDSPQNLINHSFLPPALPFFALLAGNF